MSRLRFAVPQWQTELKSALQRAKERLAHAGVNDVDWFWAKEDSLPREDTVNDTVDDRVRLLAPFDPVVRDRARFELLWGWEYRFEAYTPASKRKLGYYALPLLWRDRVIGWANLSVKKDALHSEFGYVKSQPRERAFKRELDAELERMRVFLGLESFSSEDRTSIERAGGAEKVARGKREARGPWIEIKEASRAPKVPGEPGEVPRAPPARATEDRT